jgi:hypothetical protein
VHIHRAELAHSSNVFLYFSHFFSQTVIEFVTLRLSFSSGTPSKAWLVAKKSYVRTDGRSASLSWCQAPSWGPRPDFYYCQTVAGFLKWGALSDERMGLSFTTVAGPRQRSHSRIRVPRYSWPYLTVSDSRLPNLEGQVPYLYPPGTGFSSYAPKHWVFLSELNSVSRVI